MSCIINSLINSYFFCCRILRTIWWTKGGRKRWRRIFYLSMLFGVALHLLRQCSMSLRCVTATDECSQKHSQQICACRSGWDECDQYNDAVINDASNAPAFLSCLWKRECGLCLPNRHEINITPSLSTLPLWTGTRVAKRLTASSILLRTQFETGVTNQSCILI